MWRVMACTVVATAVVFNVFYSRCYVMLWVMTCTVVATAVVFYLIAGVM